MTSLRTIQTISKLIQIPKVGPNGKWHCSLDNNTNLVLNCPPKYTEGDWIVIQYQPAAIRVGEFSPCISSTSIFSVVPPLTRNSFVNSPITADVKVKITAPSDLPRKRFQIYLDQESPEQGTMQILSYIETRADIPNWHIEEDSRGYITFDQEIVYKPLTPDMAQEIGRLNERKHISWDSARELLNDDDYQAAIKHRDAMNQKMFENIFGRENWMDAWNRGSVACSPEGCAAPSSEGVLIGGWTPKKYNLTKKVVKARSKRVKSRRKISS